MSITMTKREYQALSDRQGYEGRPKPGEHFRDSKYFNLVFIKTAAGWDCYGLLLEG